MRTAAVALKEKKTIITCQLNLLAADRTELQTRHALWQLLLNYEPLQCGDSGVL